MNNLASENFNIFYNALLSAASNIDKRYYNVKLAYFNYTMLRENVYCYELYFQLRSILNDFPYLLIGEIDQSGHPDIVARCHEFKPHFIVHQPGIFNDVSQLVLLYVYSINYAFRFPETLVDSFSKMNCTVNQQGGYYRGIMLLYGNEKAELDKGISDIYKNYCRGLYDKIFLLYHNVIGEKPVHIIL